MSNQTLYIVYQAYAIVKNQDLQVQWIDKRTPHGYHIITLYAPAVPVFANKAKQPTPAQSSAANHRIASQHSQRRLRFITLFLTIMSFSSLQAQDTEYWQCTTTDSNHTQWAIKGIYERAARGKATDACKKQSDTPGSCKTDCEGFNHGRSTRASWLCTAMDENTKSWLSQPNPQQDEAAFEAKTRCLHSSTLPETCVINLFTCKNLNSP